MLKKNLKFLGLGVLGISSIVLIGGSANAALNRNNMKNLIQLQTGTTYEEFVEKVKGTKMEGKITEEKFTKMKERMQNGSLMFGNMKRGMKGYGPNGGMMRLVQTGTTYEEFVEKVKGTKMEGKITEENFNKMKEKLKEMESIRAEREAKREKVKKAIQSHDYETWKSLKNENSQILKKIDTKEKFEKFVEMHGIMEEARIKAQTIAEELGIENMRHQERRKHKNKQKLSNNSD